MSRINNKLTILLVFVLLLGMASAITAQGEVQVTTRDNASLRSGPGGDYDRLVVIPFSTTMPATGRNEDTSWIQVDYNGTIGWVAAFLLNWSADPNVLPVGGIQAAPPPAAPAVDAPAAPPPPEGALTATNATVLNVRSGPTTGDDRVGQLPAGSTVTLLGRWGSGDTAWVMIEFEGTQAWVAGWLLTVNGDLDALPDREAEWLAQAEARNASEAAIPMVCSGAVSTMAPAYDGAPGVVHPVRVYNETGGVHSWYWNVPGAWRSQTLLATQLVACVGEQERYQIERCRYNGPDIIRYSYRMNVRLVEAQTGRVVGSGTLRGNPPRECRHSEPWNLTRLTGSYVQYSQFQDWLQHYVNP